MSLKFLAFFWMCFGFWQSMWGSIGELGCVVIFCLGIVAYVTDIAIEDYYKSKSIKR